MRFHSRAGVQQTYAHEIIPVFNDSILQEYEEVLSREKFHFPKETVEFLLSRLKTIGQSMATVESLVGNFPKHPKVVTPAEMLRILDNL